MGHKKKYTKTERRGLPGGPNEMFAYVTGVFSSSPGFYKAASDIEGYGLFADKSFSTGDLIGLAHEDGLPITELGKFHNHDEDDPTMLSKLIGNQRYVFANKNIKPGDELTTNYRLQPELEQPEDFLLKAQKGNGEIEGDEKSIIAVDKNIQLPYEDSLQHVHKPKIDKTKFSINTDFKKKFGTKFHTVLPTDTVLDFKTTLPLNIFSSVLPFDLPDYNRSKINLSLKQPIDNDTTVGFDINAAIRDGRTQLTPQLTFKHRFLDGGENDPIPMAQLGNTGKNKRGYDFGQTMYIKGDPNSQDPEYLKELDAWANKLKSSLPSEYKDYTTAQIKDLYDQGKIANTTIIDGELSPSYQLDEVEITPQSNLPYWDQLTDTQKNLILESNKPGAPGANRNPMLRSALSQAVSGYGLINPETGERNPTYKESVVDNMVIPGMGVAAMPLAFQALPHVVSLGSQTMSGVVNPILNTKIAGDITIGGALDAYGLYHGATHLPGDVQKFAENPSWMNALDIGVDALGIGAGGYAAAKQYIPTIKSGYNAVATGNSPLPIAWKSGLNEGNISAAYQGSKNYDALKGANLTDEEAEIVKLWQKDPSKVKGADRVKLDEMVSKYNLGDQSINTPLSRIQGYYGSPKNFSTKYGSPVSWDSPRSFSTGAYKDGIPVNAPGTQRIVIPKKYAKNMGEDFFKIPINENQNLQDLIQTTNVGTKENPVFMSTQSLLDEKELLGMPNLKVIGRDNSGHFNDIIVKPVGNNLSFLESLQSKGILTPNTPSSAGSGTLSMGFNPMNLFVKKPTKPKGISDLIVEKSDEFGDIVEVITADGTSKLMSKNDALKFTRIEDANLNAGLIDNLDEYEKGNWFNIGTTDGSSQVYYLQNTKDAIKGPGYTLDPEGKRRFITGFIDPADAELFNVANSTERARTLSGGVNNAPLPNEYIFPPFLVEQMRKGTGPGYTTTTGDFKSTLESLLEFQNLKKGGTVSWQWKGKTYSGPKIGEDENNIYARTHNGKVKTISKKQQGGSVSEIWQDVTGTPWSEAKNQGLTDGTYTANIALRNKLISTPSQFKQKPSNTLPPANTNSNAANATLSPEEINDKINKAKDFSSAFRIARDYYGPNKIFEYNAKQFGTNLAGETFEPSEEDMINAGLKPKQKEKIYKQNRSVVSPYTDDNIVEFDEYEDFENVKDNNANLNRMDQADLIVSYQLAHATKPYLIVDENAGRMHLYYPGEEQPVESYPILSGSNAGDAQTVTKADYYYNGVKMSQDDLNTAMRETGAKSVDALMDMPGYSAETNWDAGNKTTGAGKFTIGTVNEDSGFYDDSGQNRKTPSFVLKNEDGNEVSTVIHTVPSSKSASRINALTQANPAEMRMTNGCINGMCTDLIDMHNIHDIGEGSEIFILPEDKGNKFVYQNGQLNFRTTSENRQMYETYTDEEGNEQRGQGVNRTRNTLNYKPIKIDIDKEAFANDKFTYFDFNDEDEYNRVVVPFAKSLEDNKQDVMKVMQINGDAYNDIAKVAFGILGNETNFGDTHSAVGNFGRAVNKYFDRSSSSSPDYMAKYSTYGADQNENSAGLTQFRWKWVEKDAEQGGDLKERLKTLGITSNKDFLDAEKAALGTVAILSYYYNNRKVDNIMQDLPRHWAGTSSRDPNRDVYTKNVANNAKYFTIKEKTFQKGGGIGSDVLLKQAYAESTFRPKVTSSANAKGLTQIRPNVLSDYINANDIEGDVDLTNVSNAVDVQKWYMNDLYNASFIDKENQTDEVRIAKTLAAYNWGRGNLVDFLNEKKADYDIYKSLDWVDKLPKETKDYVNKILGKNEQFNKDYDAAINNEKYTYILNEYKSIGGEISDLKIYRDYVNGKYDGKSNLKKAEAIYDKLNRVYYHKAGQVGMSAPNYIMSYLDEASM